MESNPNPKKETIKINLPPKPTRPATIKLPTLPPENPEQKKPETKKFSTSLIADRVRSLLKSEKSIKSIDYLTVEGKGSEITLSMGALAGPLKSVVDVQAILANIRGSIAVKNYKVAAGWMIKRTVEGIISTKLNQISELLQSFIENEEKRKIEKMEIIDGELVVVFRTPQPEIQPTPESAPVAESGRKEENKGEETEKKTITWSKEKKLEDAEKQILELENVISFIDKELKEKRAIVEQMKKENNSTDQSIIEFIDKEEIESELLKLNPIEYFTRKRESDQSTLNYFVDGIPDYEPEELKEMQTLFTKKIDEWQRMINALETLNKKERE